MKMSGARPPRYRFHVRPSTETLAKAMCFPSLEKEACATSGSGTSSRSDPSGSMRKRRVNPPKLFRLDVNMILFLTGSQPITASNPG